MKEVKRTAKGSLNNNVHIRKSADRYAVGALLFSTINYKKRHLSEIIDLQTCVDSTGGRRFLLLCLQKATSFDEI